MRLLLLILLSLVVSACSKVVWEQGARGPEFAIITRTIPVEVGENSCPVEVISTRVGEYQRFGTPRLFVQAGIRNDSEKPVSRVDLTVRMLNAYGETVDKRVVYSARTTGPQQLNRLHTFWRESRARAVVKSELAVARIAFSDGSVCAAPDGSFADSNPEALEAGPDVGAGPSLADEELRRAQIILNSRHYHCGIPDGQWGPKTRACIEDFQHDNGLEVTGTLDEATERLLYGQDPGPPPTKTLPKASPSPPRQQPPSDEEEKEEIW